MYTHHQETSQANPRPPSCYSQPEITVRLLPTWLHFIATLVSLSLSPGQCLSLLRFVTGLIIAKKRIRIPLSPPLTQSMQGESIRDEKFRRSEV